jgi:hypothetical protein
MEQATMNTKTVEGYFGPKQVTRDEYVRQWTDHFSQILHLAGTTEEFKQLEIVRIQIAGLAGQKWDGLK